MTMHRLMLTGLLALAAGAARPAAADCPAPQALRQAGVPGVVIVDFAGSGQQVEACGSADLARRRPMAADTVFQAAALGEPVFALVVLRLAARGLLDLDRPLAAYFKSPYRHDQDPLGPVPVWDVVADPRLARVTARMVLSHTGGLPDWSFGKPLRLVADPGRVWHHSGEGMTYLAAALQAISGQPLQALAQAEVFGPLGMRDSSYVWRPTYAGRIATGYDGAGRALPVQRFARPLAAASLYTTPADYARFVRALLDAPPGSPLRLARGRQVGVDARYALAWGLGVGLERQLGSACAFQHGGGDGFQSFFMACPARHRAVLWFANSGRGLALAADLVPAQLPGPHPLLDWPPLRP